VIVPLRDFDVSFEPAWIGIEQRRARPAQAKTLVIVGKQYVMSLDYSEEASKCPT
jgi:hypothetical protein